MARKVAPIRSSTEAPEAVQTAKTRPGKGRSSSPAGTGSKASSTDAAAPDDLVGMALKACLIARDAAFNVRDLLTNSSRMAFLAIKECEKELDIIERYIDERLPAAITRVNEARARQLLTSLKCTTDLERIGDLVYRGFVDLDLECARKVLQMDKDIDRVCHGLFQKHLIEQASENPSSFDV